MFAFSWTTTREIVYNLYKKCVILTSKPYLPRHTFVVRLKSNSSIVMHEKNAFLWYRIIALCVTQFQNESKKLTL